MRNGTTNNRMRDYRHDPRWGYAGHLHDASDLIQKLGIFAPDPVADDDFHRANNAPWRAAWGERLLRLAVVQDAITCYLTPKRLREEQNSYERRRRDAERWLTRRDSGDTFSFVFICEEILRTDPVAMWEAIKRMARRRQNMIIEE